MELHSHAVECRSLNHYDVILVYDYRLSEAKLMNGRCHFLHCDIVLTRVPGIRDYVVNRQLLDPQNTPPTNYAEMCVLLGVRSTASQVVRF